MGDVRLALIFIVALTSCDERSSDRVVYYSPFSEMSSLICSVDDVFSFSAYTKGTDTDEEERLFCSNLRLVSIDAEVEVSEVNGFDLQGDLAGHCSAKQTGGVECFSVEREEASDNSFDVDVDDFTFDYSVDVSSLESFIDEIPHELHPILLFAEGEYLFDRPLVVTRSTSLRGVGSSKTTLRTFSIDSPLVFHPKEAQEFDLFIDTPLNSEDIGGLIGESNCSSILITDKDSLWPYDERDYVFFGELNKLKLSHDQPRLMEGLRDDYLGDVSVKVFCPISVEISGIHVQVENTSVEQKAISITGAKGLKITGVEISGAGKAGLWIAESSGVLVTENVLEGVFPQGCKTCYGIQTYGSKDVEVSRNLISGFRRGVDVSGIVPSRRVLVEGNVVFADSDVSRGASGLGTHGSAEDVVFLDNYSSGGIISMLLRGTQISVVNNVLENSEYSALYIADGASQYVYGNTLGGQRLNGTPTNRAIDFSVSSGHQQLSVIANQFFSKEGVSLNHPPNNYVELDNVQLTD